MRLIVQVPCFNEELNLKEVLDQIPTSITGVDEIIKIIIDDASTDKTREVAKACNVAHIVQLPENHGLGTAFDAGLRYAESIGADIVVNLDGDNQYPASKIPILIKPILDKKADIVIASRINLSSLNFKKFLLQIIADLVVSFLSSYRIRDVSSGFRAYNKKAISKISSHGLYTYTFYTLIQASFFKLRISTINIEARSLTRPSRLIRNYYDHTRKQTVCILKGVWRYKKLELSLLLCLTVIILIVLSE